MKRNRGTFVFIKDLQKDFNTFKSLRGKQKLQFLWDYYKWRIIVLVFSIIAICTFAHMFWEGQKPCRLQVCVVLNTEYDCSSWFDEFEMELKKDGKSGAVEVNQDQPFDYDNQYYYVQELEVMSTVSSGRMDVAICGKDMYRYLLALNACYCLDDLFSEEFFTFLYDKGMIDYNTANLQEDENGNVNPADGIDGYYAVNLSGTEFYDVYNNPEDTNEPLYAVVISNTEHLEDCISLINALTDY